MTTARKNLDGSLQHTLSLYIAHQALIDIIERADSNYWILDYSPEYEANVLTLKQPEVGAESDIPAVNLEINAASIAAALEKMAAGVGDEHGSNVRRTFGRVLTAIEDDRCGADSDVCDCVLQHAIFGAIKYG